MPIDPVKIPQNVYIEDRVVGPLTLRQLMVIGIGGGFSYAVYASVSKQYGPPSIPLTILIWIPALISAAIALVKVNDLSLMKIAFLSLERVNKPTERVWTPRRGISINIRMAPPVKSHEITPEMAEHLKARQKIQELSSVLDHGIGIAAEPVSAFERNTIRNEAAQNTSEMAKPEPEDMMSEDEEPTVSIPVNPSRIAVDKPLGTSNYALSDLSVFRDIFPQR